MRIVVISDTHGLLRPEALPHLRGAELVIHAGDVGSAEVLGALRALGPPLVVVRGNVDHGPWARELPASAVAEAAGQRIYVLHDLGALAFDPATAGFAAVVSGHSHRPRIKRHPDGVLFLNPGAAGPRRFRLPVCLAILEIEPGTGKMDCRLQELAPPAAR